MKSHLFVLTTSAAFLFAAPAHFPIQAHDYTDHTRTQKQKLEDRQVVEIMMDVDKGEIAASKEAFKKNMNKPVKLYALFLIEQHEANLERLTQLAKEIGLEPAESPQSISMASHGKEGLEKLSALDGGPFEKAFIDAMVKGHQGGLNLIDTKLSREVTNPQLKSFLVSFRAMVADHLQKALVLQKEFVK